MLNLDWFQPYDGTIYSIGVIYAAICNLPRDIRFKRENLLTLGILPGPSEVGLHKINHYLAPIINELKTLWDGMTYLGFRSVSISVITEIFGIGLLILIPKISVITETETD